MKKLTLTSTFWSYLFMANRWGKYGNSDRLVSWGSKSTMDGDCSLLLGRKTLTTLYSILKSRDITLPTKAHIVKAMVLSRSHVWMLDHKEGWVPKNWCFQTVVLEKTLESPLNSKEIRPVHPKGNQYWILIRRADVESEAPKPLPPDVKKRLIRKDPDAGKDRGGEGGDRGWDGWMASLTRWTWVWANCEIGKNREAWHAEVQGSQRVRQDWAVNSNNRTWIV